MKILLLLLFLCCCVVRAQEPPPGIAGVIERPAAQGSGADFEVRLEDGKVVNVIDDIGAGKLGEKVEVVTQTLGNGRVIYRLSPGDNAAYVEGSVERIISSPADEREPRVLGVRLITGKLAEVQDDSRRFAVGDKIEVYPTLGPENEFIFYANDHVRRLPLLWLALGFVAVAALVGRGKGLRAVLAMGLSLLIILLLIVPGISSGLSPVLVALGGSSLILAASVYFVHGINWTAHSSLLATVLAATVTLILAHVFAAFAHLTGLGAEEGALILQMSQAAGVEVNLRALLIAGILIGALGALVDSTVAQAAVVRELSNINPNLDWRALYKSGMAVGFDHIGSLVNTLVLANLGSSLPLWVVFTLGQMSFAQAVNLELVATEIVHALIGSIGLILAVPLATFIAAWLFAGGRFPGTDNVHSHAQVMVPQTRSDALARALEMPLERPRKLETKDLLPPDDPRE
ncbi:MAG: YibE/F family protein [Deinococcales bacterium]